MHIGRNIGKLRSFRGIKQQDMAKRLKMTQQNYSLIENSEKVDDDLLKRIAGVLDYEPDFIKELPDTPHVYSTHQQGGNVINYEFNPIEKIVELYERLLESERKRVEQLETLINTKPVTRPKK